jgi:hypothetical protein
MRSSRGPKFPHRATAHDFPLFPATSRTFPPARYSLRVTDILKLLLNGTPIANLADNAASSPITNTYLALHTADPHGGDQTTNEAAYPSYARVAVVRTSSGWSVSGNVASLVATASFPAATGTPSETELYVSVGFLSSGAGKIIASGALSSAIVVSAAGQVPQCTSGSTLTAN